MSSSTKRNVAEYEWTDDDGNRYEKRIIVEYDEEEDDLTVTFEASQDDNEDEKEFAWYRYLELLDAIKGDEYGAGGREFIENVFVGGLSGPAAVSEQRSIVGKNPTIGALETEPGQEDENGSFLRVYYQTEKSDRADMLTMRWVQSDDDGELYDNVGQNAGDYYAWQLQDHELQLMLQEDPDVEVQEDRELDQNSDATEGFSREFREALFLNPRRQRVIEML